MKKAVYFLMIALLVGAAQASLKVDFTKSGTPNSPLQDGYSAYVASDKSASSFTAQSFSAFGGTVTITPSWASNTSANAMRVIDRSSRLGGIESAYANLFRDWIATDARLSNRPGGQSMTLTISGLAAGTYSWLSYHHDLEDQTGIFDMIINDADGSKTIADVDITASMNVDKTVTTMFTIDQVCKVNTTFKSDGVNPITLVFAVDLTNPLNGNADHISEQFFVMNGFEIVPEPATMMILALGGLMALKKRK